MHVSIYCDESCHLENDESDVMGLGAVWAEKAHVKRLARELRELKNQYNANGELKWTKVSKSRMSFYAALLDWFFRTEELHFRCLIVPRKKELDHAQFNDGSHDTFYYKMYFSLLNKILSPSSPSEIYLDIKDTRSRIKVRHLQDVLCNDQYDFTGEAVRRIQQARSHELELMQLADFLLGCVVYYHRGLTGNEAKVDVSKRTHALAPNGISITSYLSNLKFNVFVWRHQT